MQPCAGQTLAPRGARMRTVIGSEVSSGLCVEDGRKTQFAFDSMVCSTLVEEAVYLSA